MTNKKRFKDKVVIVTELLAESAGIRQSGLQGKVQRLLLSQGQRKNLRL